MGDYYSVELRMRVGRGTKTDLALMLRTWMKRVEEGTDATPGVTWAWAHNRRNGARPDSLKGIMKIILAAHRGNFRWRREYDGYDLYRSDFNAAYSWACVMRDAFREMAPFLDDGSYLYIDRDEGVDNLEVRKGRLWQEEREDARELPYASAPRSGTKARRGRRSRSAAR